MHGRVQTMLDLAVAAAVIAFAEIEVLTGQVTGPLWAGVLSGILLGVPLALRRRYPWAALVVVFGTFLLAWAVGVSLHDYLATVISGLIALYSFAATVSTWHSLAGFAFAYAATIVSALGHSPGNLGWGLILLGGAWLAGRAIRGRRQMIEALRRTAEELAESRETNARAAVADERSRIARELHDVVAHAVSVIVIQAGAAERMLAQDPVRAQQALASVQESGRQALAELRRLLGVLRPGAPPPADLSPQPGLSDLDRLVAGLSEAGLMVSVHQHGDPRSLSPGVDLAAYRIVQEALTNVLKHADTDRAKVAVRYGHDALELEIVDNGRARTGQRATTGHGLVGMRERAAVYGGRLQASPHPDGGYTVRAWLPIACPR